MGTNVVFMSPAPTPVFPQRNLLQCDAAVSQHLTGVSSLTAAQHGTGTNLVTIFAPMVPFPPSPRPAQEGRTKPWVDERNDR